MDIRFFDTLDSTNSYCKLLDPKSVGEFTVIWAGNQTAGLGQKGNVWCSEPYKNLTFSLILKPSFLPFADQWLLSMTLALAVSDFVAEQLSTVNCPPKAANNSESINVSEQLSTTIKWPNDIYIGNRKACGILVTNQVCGKMISQSICGIGLNVNQTSFPDWIPNPTSLSIETGLLYDLKPLLEQLLDKIVSRYSQLKEHHDSIKPEYMRRLYRLNKPSLFVYNNQTITATITDVDHLGHLHLTSADYKEISCDLKEIQFLL